MFISDEVSSIPCFNCGGEVKEYSIPNHIWNMIVRKNGKESDGEYLCIWCFVIMWINDFQSEVK